MKILHISSASTWRGGEQQIAYLIEGLHRNGVDSIIMTPKGSELSRKSLKGDPQIITYKKRFSVNPMVSLQIMKVCREHRIDGIHIHDSHAHTFTYIAYKLGLSTPSVLSRRVDFPIKNGSYNKYNHPMIKRILCVSNAIGTIVKKAVKEHAKVITVYSGVDARKLLGAKQLDSEEHSFLTSGNAIIGNVAALAGHKDHHTFVLTIDRYRKIYGLEGLHFVIVGGDGGEEESIRTLIKDLDLLDHISLVGYVNNPQDYLASFDLFLFTSKMEGLGTSVIDAMTMGLPIVSTQAGGLVELVIDGETALAVPVGKPERIAERLYELLSNQQLQDTLSHGARKKAKSFEVSNMVKGTLEVYRELWN